MWLWQKIIPLNSPEVVFSYTEGRLYLKVKMQGCKHYLTVKI